MLVYGDPQFSITLAEVVAQLKWPGPTDAEAWRAFLIRAGQIEQGLADAHAPADLLCQSRRLTDGAAEVFLDLLRGKRRPEELHAGTLAPVLDQLVSAPFGPPIAIKVPEGFEFYSLFPEQYARASELWVGQNSTASNALVVGIRSIGTTLSAVIRSVLVRAGLHAARTTVRPSGDPFSRRVDLEGRGETFSHALVVDEGPGLSGSSMAAVAEALRAHGITNITFFPGHCGEPGSAASTTVRKCWVETPRIVVSLGDLRWNRQPLSEHLSNAAAAISGAEPAGPMRDLSSGAWRDYIYPDKVQPPAAPFLERTKLLWEGQHGRKLLWKFEGLGSFKELEEGPPFENLVATALGSRYGFHCYEWIEGTRLDATDARSATTLKHLADYCLARACPPLSKQQHRAAIDRLTLLLESNTRELFHTRFRGGLAKAVELAHQTDPGPTYGDGRMGPWEWVRTREGAIIKTDWRGHSQDHTFIGRQSVLWDAAGVVVEWDLRETELRKFRKHLCEAGVNAPPELMRFYCAAYAAFRAGICSMANDQTYRLRYVHHLRINCLP